MHPDNLHESLTDRVRGVLGTHVTTGVDGHHCPLQPALAVSALVQLGCGEHVAATRRALVGLVGRDPEVLVERYVPTQERFPLMSVVELDQDGLRLIDGLADAVRRDRMNERQWRPVLIVCVLHGIPATTVSGWLLRVALHTWRERRVTRARCPAVQREWNSS